MRTIAPAVIQQELLVGLREDVHSPPEELVSLRSFSNVIELKILVLPLQQSRRDSEHGRLQEGGEGLIRFPQPPVELKLPQVRCITGELLIAPLTHLDNNRSVVPGQFRDEVKRNADRIRKRLVLMVDQLGQEVECHLLIDEYFVVIGLELAGDLPGVVKLVVLFEMSKAHRKRVDGTIH